jgi:hypothetical protein
MIQKEVSKDETYRRTGNMIKRYLYGILTIQLIRFNLTGSLFFEIAASFWPFKYR